MPIGQAYRNGIKSIQRGVYAWAASTGTSATVTVNAVDPAKTELRNLGGFSGTRSAPALQLTNATTITITKGLNSEDARVAWELVERY